MTPTPPCQWCVEHERVNEDLRRLVEEAQRERDAYRRAKAENDERFMGERDMARAEADRLQGELETELIQHATSYDKMRAERDILRSELYGSSEALADLLTANRKLKGELAEAEQLVRDAMGRPEWAGWYTRAQQHFAATPAEQAQGEGAKPCTCGSGAHARRCAEHPWGYGQHLNDLSLQSACDDTEKTNAQVAALAKRVDASDLDFVTLERRVRWMEEAVDRKAIIAPPPAPDYAHHHEFRQWEREGWPDRCGVRVREGDAPQCCQPEDWYGHTMPPPPPPDAAGPGHVFVPCTDDGVKWRCFMCGMVATAPVHAVPPIPEGGAR